MKKYILGFAVVLLMVPTVVPAVTVDELQTQIRSLLGRISELRQQIGVMQQASTTGVSVIQVSSANPARVRVCDFFAQNSNWGQGTSGEHITALQEFLKDKGYLGVSPTGYFGSLTLAAIKRLQSSEGIESVGVVGPITQNYFKKWCGVHGLFEVNPRTGAAPLTVVFNSWVGGLRPAGVSYLVEYGDGGREAATECSAPADACVSPGENKHTYTQAGTYTATLNKITDPCLGNPLCMAPVSSEVVAKIQITVGGNVACTKEYRPVCGQPTGCENTCPPGAYCAAMCKQPDPKTYSNTCVMEAAGATLLYEGQCRIDNKPFEPAPTCKTWYDGCNDCSRDTVGAVAMCTLRACIWQAPGYCKEYFDGVRENQPPVVSGFSGPTHLTVNETGTWSVEARDPEQKTLSYKVTWGDETGFWNALDAVASALGFGQVTTFTHTYSKAGMYTVTAVVRDPEGKEAKTTITVTVSSGGPVACTMEYAPVCATPYYCLVSKFALGSYPYECQYGKTYGNQCQMEAEKAVFKYAGECAAATDVVCTQEAKQCPDGSYVGRTGPNCAFAPCPTTAGGACTFDNTAVGGMCGGAYHCAAGANHHYWSTTFTASCIAAR